MRFRGLGILRVWRSAKGMRKNAKLAAKRLRQVAIFPHNADFYWLRKSKMPANAAHINDISALGFGYGQFFPDYCAM